MTTKSNSARFFSNSVKSILLTTLISLGSLPAVANNNQPSSRYSSQSTARSTPRSPSPRPSPSRSPRPSGGNGDFPPPQ